ncbi:MAG: polysaccharide deacetylase family protein [bacterium]
MSENGVVTSLETIKIAYNNPTINYLSKNITHGNRFEPKVALTFDGGYLANACEEILDILKAKELQCTIFLSGRFITKYPAIVKRMVAEGHEIGNHTWNHPHLTEFVENKVQVTKSTVTREFLQKQLNDTALAFNACTGQSLMPFWRAPYGEHNLEIREWAAEMGYRHIAWTLGPNWQNTMDTMDWVADSTSPAYHTAEEILEKILGFGNGSNTGANGAIIIMHLGTLRNHDFPHKKLPEIIDGLKAQGYELVRVSEMID